MIATSATTLPVSILVGGEGTAVSRQSDSGWIRLNIAGPRLSRRCGSTSLDRVRELAKGREMEVGRRDLLRHRGSAKALDPLATLDPAHLVPKRAGDADVMVLALGDMQDVLLPVPERRLPPKIVREKARIGLGILGVVDRDAIVERQAESVGAGAVGDAVEIRHGHQPEAAA